MLSECTAKKIHQRYMKYQTNIKLVTYNTFQCKKRKNYIKYQTFLWKRIFHLKYFGLYQYEWMDGWMDEIMNRHLLADLVSLWWITGFV